MTNNGILVVCVCVSVCIFFCFYFLLWFCNVLVFIHVHLKFKSRQKTGQERGARLPHSPPAANRWLSHHSGSMNQGSAGMVRKVMQRLQAARNQGLTHLSAHLTTHLAQVHQRPDTEVICRRGQANQLGLWRKQQTQGFILLHQSYLKLASEEKTSMPLESSPATSCTVWMGLNVLCKLWERLVPPGLADIVHNSYFWLRTTGNHSKP